MLASGSPQSMVPSACAKCTSGTSEDGNGRLPCGSLLPVPSSSSCDAAVATWANATSKNENALRSISNLQSMLSSSSWDLGYWPMTDEHAALPGSSLQSRLSSSSGLGRLARQMTRRSCCPECHTAKQQVRIAQAARQKTRMPGCNRQSSIHAVKQQLRLDDWHGKGDKCHVSSCSRQSMLSSSWRELHKRHTWTKMPCCQAAVFCPCC